MKWPELPITTCVQMLALLLVLHWVSRFEEFFYRFAKDKGYQVRWYHRAGFAMAFGVCFSLALSIVRSVQ